MPRDNDKNNGPSRGRRDRPSGGKGRSGAPRGPDKKFAKRGFAGKSEGDKPAGARSYGKKPYAAGKPYAADKPYAGKRDGAAPRRDYGDTPRREREDAPRRSYGDAPRRGSSYAPRRGSSDAPRRDYGDTPRRDYGDTPRPARFNRDERPARSREDRPERAPRKDFRPRDDRGGEKRAYTPREGGEKRPYTPRTERGDARPAGRFADKKFGDKKFGDKRPYTPRGEGFRKDGPRKEFGSRDGDRPQRDRSFGDKPRGDRPFGDKRFSRGAPDRGPRKEFGSRPDRGPRKDYGDRPERGESKPWQKREAGSRDEARRDSRPSRDGARSFDKPRFDRPREARDGGERPRFSRPREDRDDARRDWHEHPRSEGRGGRFSDRPRRENEDDSKVFAKRPAFGGRGAYRERVANPDKRIARPQTPVKKEGERIAKLIARAGLASRRDAEEWVTQGRVTVNGRVINSPALDITPNDVVTVDGQPLPERERTRLFLYHKPRGLMTTHSDPEGRPTVFDHLPERLPRLISVGRLDFNTEGLLLLTNDGGLARVLELPDTGWLRRYRARAHGEITQAQLDGLRDGIEVDGVKYGAVDATLERDQGSNVWITIAIREGKNREVRNILGALGLEVNRLIRISYGPFQLGEILEGEVEEVKTRVLREQLGDKVAALAGAEFARTVEADAGVKLGRDGTPLRPKKSKPRAKRSVVEDRKGRSVAVQRTGSDEARARNEANVDGSGPPRRPKRGYHGKRDLKPRD